MPMSPSNVGLTSVAGGESGRLAAPPASLAGGGVPLSGDGSAIEPMKVPGASVEEARIIAREMNTRADFNKFQAQVQIDEATNHFVFQIRTREEGKLIRQIPPEGILFMAAQLQANGPNGLLLDEHI